MPDDPITAAPPTDFSAMATATATPPPTSAPDVTSSSPAPAIPDTGSALGAAQTKATGYENQAELHNQMATDAAARKMPPPGPHARLYAMIAGLGAGLSAFGTSISTGGKEGGAPEVNDFIKQQQELKIQKQQAFQQQKDAEVNQQITIADTNHKMAQNVMYLATLPNEIAKSDLAVSGAKIAQAGEQQSQAITGADFQASHGGMKPEEYSAALSSDAPAGSPGVNPFFVTSARQQMAAATRVLGADDAYVKKLQDVLADPKATPKDLVLATTQVQSQLKLQSDAIDQQVKKDAAESNDPVTKMSTPEFLAAPGAQASIQAKIADPTTNPNDIPRLKLLLGNADTAQAHARYLDALKAEANKNAEQAANAGDPKVAGQMLADGLLTLTDLKSRGSTPKQIEDASQAAIAYAKSQGRTYNPDDEIVGEKMLGEIGNQTFFGSARSLAQSGGMLDQLKVAHDNLGNGAIPVLNKYADWVKYQAGSPALATYRAAVLGAADDYAKVIGGGNPSDSAREASADEFIYNLNQGQFNGAVEQARGAVQSQVKGRIGSNGYVLKREGDILQAPTPTVKASDYPRPATVSAGAKLMQVPGGAPHWIEPQNIPAAQSKGATEVQ